MKLIFVLVLFGLGITSYLSYLSISSHSVPCLASNPQSCSMVLGSRYAYAFGIPVSVLGFLTYALILFLLWKHDNKWFHYAELSLVGIFAAGYFNYLMFFEIGAVCVLCEMSHAAMTGIFLLSERWNFLKAIFIFVGVLSMGVAFSAILSSLIAFKVF